MMFLKFDIESLKLKWNYTETTLLQKEESTVNSTQVWCALFYINLSFEWNWEFLGSEADL